MADTDVTQADGYYGEDASNEEFDLSFLDDKSEE